MVGGRPTEEPTVLTESDDGDRVTGDVPNMRHQGGSSGFKNPTNLGDSKLKL